MEPRVRQPHALTDRSAVIRALGASALQIKHITLDLGIVEQLLLFSIGINSHSYRVFCGSQSVSISGGVEPDDRETDTAPW